MSAAHTPGPWHTAAYETFFAVKMGPRSVAIIQSLTQEAEANARLIAAAPDLLEAAELVLTGAAPETLRAAVRKARSE